MSELNQLIAKLAQARLDLDTLDKKTKEAKGLAQKTPEYQRFDGLSTLRNDAQFRRDELFQRVKDEWQKTGEDHPALKVINRREYAYPDEAEMVAWAIDHDMRNLLQPDKRAFKKLADAEVEDLPVTVSKIKLVNIAGDLSPWIHIATGGNDDNA